MEEWHIQQRGSLVARLLHYTIDHSREKEREEAESVGGRIQDGTILDTDSDSQTVVAV